MPCQRRDAGIVHTLVPKAFEMTRAFLVLTLICWIAPAWARPAELPDPRETPGAIAKDGDTEASVCGLVDGLTYSKRHRNSEVDHRARVALGGKNAYENLWCQLGPARGVEWDYHDKDRLEVEVIDRICQQPTMTPQDAQAVVLVPDWGAQYCKVWPSLAGGMRMMIGESGAV